MLNLFLVSCVLGLVAAVALNVCCYVWSYCNMFVHGISNYGDSLAHGECSKNCSDSQAVDMNEILILEYFADIISDSSLGKRSVGMIGSPHLLDSAIPIHIKM